MSDQAYKTPLVDLLRRVPEDHRTEWVTQWSEDGRETGHAMCPIGRLAHEAADRITELEAAQAQAELEIICDDNGCPTEVRIAQAQATPPAAVPEGFVLVPRAAVTEVLRISDRQHPAWEEVRAAILAAQEQK